MLPLSAPHPGMPMNTSLGCAILCATAMYRCPHPGLPLVLSLACASVGAAAARARAWELGYESRSWPGCCMGAEWCMQVLRCPLTGAKALSALRAGLG